MVDLNVLSGKPIIRGTRLSVPFLLNLLAHGATTDEILQEYKGLAPEDIQASLLYVAKVFDERGTYTSPETYGVARRAQAFYDDEIRARVETEENIGKMIVIDSDTGAFEIGESGAEASLRLHELHPGARLYGIRIGYNVAVSFGGNLYRIDAKAPKRPGNELAILSQAALAGDWNRPEEDEAWSHLQAKQ
jgi:uncharacterized protein (DUF433 family)